MPVGNITLSLISSTFVCVCEREDKQQGVCLLVTLMRPKHLQLLFHGIFIGLTDRQEAELRSDTLCSCNSSRTCVFQPSRLCCI